MLTARTCVSLCDHRPLGSLSCKKYVDAWALLKQLTSSLGTEPSTTLCSWVMDTILWYRARRSMYELLYNSRFSRHLMSSVRKLSFSETKIIWQYKLIMRQRILTRRIQQKNKGTVGDHWAGTWSGFALACWNRSVGICTFGWLDGICGVTLLFEWVEIGATLCKSAGFEAIVAPLHELDLAFVRTD
jgi:hypothetical protein